MDRWSYPGGSGAAHSRGRSNGPARGKTTASKGCRHGCVEGSHLGRSQEACNGTGDPHVYEEVWIRDAAVDALDLGA